MGGRDSHLGEDISLSPCGLSGCLGGSRWKRCQPLAQHVGAIQLPELLFHAFFLIVLGPTQDILHLRGSAAEPHGSSWVGDLHYDDRDVPQTETVAVVDSQQGVANSM